MKPERIRRAAEILRNLAESFKVGDYHINGQWLSESARQTHDEMLALSIELDMLAAK